MRALEAEVAGLREALAEALERAKTAEGQTSQAEYQGMARFKPGSRRTVRPPHGEMRMPPRMIKHHTHHFSERYIQHILGSC